MNILFSGRSALQTSHGKHDHETWEIVSNLEGEGVLEFEDGNVPFDERTIVCIPPYVKHAKYAPGGYRDIWVSFSEFPMLDASKPTVLCDDSERNITSLIQILYSVQYSKEPNKRVVAECLLESIQQLILSHLERKPLDPRVEEIANHIIHHFQDPAFSIDECLSRDGYCSDHMRRLFREQIGKTPHEYLTHLRVKTAKKLLASRDISNYSVAEICTMVGFNDVCYFSRVFKRATGVSPSEYFEK